MTQKKKKRIAYYSKISLIRQDLPRMHSDFHLIQLNNFNYTAKGSE